MDGHELFDQGMELLRQKKYEDALTAFVDSYSQGYMRAAFYIGEIYSHGYGVEPDLTTAYQFYDVARQNGVMEARGSINRILDGYGPEKPKEPSKKALVMLGAFIALIAVIIGVYLAINYGV